MLFHFLLAHRLIMMIFKDFITDLVALFVEHLGKMKLEIKRHYKKHKKRK